MAYQVSEEKKKQWKEKSIENQNKAREMIMDIGANFVDNPDSIAEVLKFSSKFYQYSIGNNELIYAQSPQATFVQSFEAWKKMDVHVLKGSVGTKIWVPVKMTMLLLENGEKVALSDATEEQKKDYKNGLIQGKSILHYKIGTVFDIGQTDFPKERYPELYSMGYSSENHAAITKGLIKFCDTQGCKVTTENLESISRRGYYEPSTNRIVLNELLEDTGKLSTLSHEMGHMLQKHGSSEKNISSSQKEFEADSISVLIQSYYGLELSDTRKSHLAYHYKNFEKELEISNPGITKEEKIKRIESVLDTSVRVFREFAKPMEEYVKAEIDKRVISLTLDNKPLLNYSYEVVECHEFPSMGATYSNISSVAEAIAIYNAIPEERKNLVGGINLVGIASDGSEMENIPVLSGKGIDLDMLKYYPSLKDNMQADKMIKELVDEMKKGGAQTYGAYEFITQETNHMNLGNRRRR